MQNNEPTIIDLTKSKDVLKILPCQPVYSSTDAGWKGIQLLHNSLPAWETVEHSYTQHLIDVSEFTQLAKLERTFDNKKQETLISTGEVAIIPAETPHKLAWNQAGDVHFYYSALLS